MAKPDVWMPLYVADYLADTSHLSCLEHGAYLLLIMHYWRNGELPADDTKLARIVKCTPKEWGKIRETIADFFTEGWKHKRIDQELAAASAAVERNRVNGRKGGRPRKENPEETHRITQTKPAGYPEQNPVGNPNERPSPSPSPSPSERNIQSSSSSQSMQDTARATEPPKAAPPEFHPRYREVRQQVEDLLASPNLHVFGRVDAWLKAGADPETDIFPTLERLKPNWRGRNLEYFDEAIADAVATRTRPLAAGTASASGEKFNPVAYIRSLGKEEAAQ